MSKRWYVLNVYSGSEQRVKDAILENASKQKMENYFGDIMIPTEEVMEVKKGKRVTTERKFFPGYILINMEMNDNAWHLVKSVPKVTGFLGGGKKPVPMTDAEASRLIKQVEEGVERPRSTVSFDIGEEVKVIDGPFASFNGSVEEVDEEKQKLKVTVSIFGRATPVELEYTQVEKA
ncbi:MAG TPA: transcription termination/antitermination protein NusG [Rhodospirillaceae bacterium]|nr:transcription termination/antitermination protein NusG [Rhodospirillaceae bacterium]|tara:strand:+ start:2054 stop:2584 length:531 start_codon:yes stop_codon:yes gene_type:complete